MQIVMEEDEETQEPKSLSEEEIKAIFKYVIRSQTFKKLSFEGCLLPITLSSDSIPADMQSRDIKVFWNDYGYILNLQSGVWKVDNVDTIKRICTENVNIFRDDSILLQKCTIQLLENASYYDIPISCLNLWMSFSKIDAGDVILHSGLRLSCPVSVKKVVIDTMDEGREMTETEVIDILTFVQQSRMLGELEFDGCLLPLTFSSKSIPSELQFRKMKVSWSNYGYSLDLQSGLWKVNEDVVRKLCTQTKYIQRDDSELLQRCTIQFLENASNYHIPISCLYLYKSFSKIDAGEAILHSGLRLLCPATVKKILINTSGEGREMTETEVIDILMFVQQSHMLEELEFEYCLLPQSIPAESIPSILKSRNVKVSWGPNFLLLYTMNLQSGRWMRRDTRQEITDTEYHDTVRKFREN